MPNSGSARAERAAIAVTSGFLLRVSGEGASGGEVLKAPIDEMF